MKYVLLALSTLLILYPILGILKCVETIGHLSNYGIGVLCGGLLLMASGILLMYFTLKSLKNKK